MAENFMHLYTKQMSPQKARASGGGAQTPRDVMGYQAPYRPGYSSTSGPGEGGDNFGNSGTQGKHDLCETSGGPGLGGKNHGMGTNRKG